MGRYYSTLGSQLSTEVTCGVRQWARARPELQGVSKRRPRACGTSITWELVRDTNSQAHLRPTESETLGVGPRNLSLNKHSRRFGHVLKFQNCCSRIRGSLCGWELALVITQLSSSQIMEI